jgi:hypothetical protein
MSHDPEESSHGYYVIIFAARFKLQEYSYLPEIQAPGALDGVLKTVKAIGGHKPLYVKILNQLRTRISESY